MVIKAHNIVSKLYYYTKIVTFNSTVNGAEYYFFHARPTDLLF